MSRLKQILSKPLGGNSFFESEDNDLLKGMGETDSTKKDKDKTILGGTDGKPVKEEEGDGLPDDVENAFSDDDSEEAKEARLKQILTPVLIGESMTSEEIDLFRESVDSDIAIQDNYVTERTIVKMDKAAKRSQLEKIACISEARDAKDPLYKKLALVWKMERTLEQKIVKKYRSKAKQRVNQYLKKARTSKVAAIKNAAHKIMGEK